MPNTPALEVPEQPGHGGNPYGSLPCLNPHCKSYGRPHPNCRCYSGGESWQKFSKGGNVGFCSGPNKHQPGCEYYMDDGGFVPDSQFVPDAQQPQQANPPGFVPDSQFKADSGFVPDSQFKPDDESWTEQLKAGAEGAAEGFLGPLAPLVETGLGISTKENIARRQQEFPMTHGIAKAATMVGSLLTGTGEAGLIAKGAESLAEGEELGRIGTGVLKGVLEGASFTTADEMSKAILGVPGSDPSDPVGAALLHIGGAGLVGGVAGSVFGLGSSLIGKGAEALKSPEIVDGLNNLVQKVGDSEDPMKTLKLDKLIKEQASYLSTAAGFTATGFVKSHFPFMPSQIIYPLIQKVFTPQFEKAANIVINKARPYVTDAIAKGISSGEVDSIPAIIPFIEKVERGAQTINKSMQSIFDVGQSQIVPLASDAAKNHLKSFVEKGGVDQQLNNSQGPQGFADGGQVQMSQELPTTGFAKVFPTQNMLLHAAKGRVYGYLNNIRQIDNAPKPAFDDDMKSEDKEKSYDRALSIAANPMEILNHVNQGDLTPEDMQHFKGMYPEAHNYLSKEMTKKITEAQLKKEKPPFSKIQSMSLFLGTDLDSSLTPQALMTIQGLYGMNKMQQQQQPPTKNKKGTSTLSKGPNAYLTDGQAREQREQNSKS